MTGRYQSSQGVADRYGRSLRWVHERTRAAAIPHRILPFSRACLFDPAWLDAWDDGCELERIDLHGGGRIVRPKEAA